MLRTHAGVLVITLTDRQLLGQSLQLYLSSLLNAYSHQRQLNQLVIKFSLVLMGDITTPMAMSNQDTELLPVQHLSSPRVWSFVHNILLIPQIRYTLLRRYGSV